LWAFVKRASDFAWRLLAVTVIINVLVSLFGIGGAFLLGLLWIGFSINIGRIANRQIERSLTRRRFIQIGEFAGVDGDQAITEIIG
jgi:hypothetical protein